MSKRNSADHGLPVPGDNDMAPGHGPNPYRTSPKLGKPEGDRDYFPAGIPVVKADEIAHNNGTRTGRSE